MKMDVAGAKGDSVTREGAKEGGSGYGGCRCRSPHSQQYSQCAGWEGHVQRACHSGVGRAVGAVSAHPQPRRIVEHIVVHAASEGAPKLEHGSGAVFSLALLVLRLNTRQAFRAWSSQPCPVVAAAPSVTSLSATPYNLTGAVCVSVAEVVCAA